MVNLNSLVDEHRYELISDPTNLFGTSYLCISGDTGRTYRLAVEDNCVFYTCSCPAFDRHLECKHGDTLVRKLAHGETFESLQIPGRIVSGSAFDLFDGDEVTEAPARRKLILEEIFSY